MSLGSSSPKRVTLGFRLPAQRDERGTENAMSTATELASRRGTTVRDAAFLGVGSQVGADTVAALHGTVTRRDPRGCCVRSIAASCRSRSSRTPDAARGSGRG